MTCGARFAGRVWAASTTWGSSLPLQAPPSLGPSAPQYTKLIVRGAPTPHSQCGVQCREVSGRQTIFKLAEMSWQICEPLPLNWLSRNVFLSCITENVSCMPAHAQRSDRQGLVFNGGAAARAAEALARTVLPLNLPADYRVPVVLRQLGVLKYSQHLSRQVGPPPPPPPPGGDLQAGVCLVPLGCTHSLVACPPRLLWQLFRLALLVRRAAGLRDQRPPRDQAPKAAAWLAAAWRLAAVQGRMAATTTIGCSDPIQPHDRLLQEYM